MTDHLLENDLAINALVGESDQFSFRISPHLYEQFYDRVVAPAVGVPVGGSHLVATALLSTMIGMRMPGRSAIFTGFDVSFSRPVELNETYAWIATVQKVAPATEAVELSVSLVEPGRADGGVIANGTAMSMVAPPPRPTITCQEIQQNYLDAGLNGKVGIITGASRGIGAATAKLLAMHGVKVTVNYLHGQADAEAVVDDIRSAGGVAIAVRCDITQPDQVAEMIARTAHEHGGVDILVNNAVRDAQPRAMLELEWEDFLGELDVSLKGMHLCCRQTVPLMKARGMGKIINLSTIFVDNPVKGQGKYITAKSAVVGYSRSLAKELAGDNIQVNVICPAMTHTDLLAPIPTEMVRRMAQRHAGKRNLDPIDVAQGIVFLASNASNAMTGQRLVFNLGEGPFL